MSTATVPVVFKTKEGRVWRHITAEQLDRANIQIEIIGDVLPEESEIYIAKMEELDPTTHEPLADDRLFIHADGWWNNIPDADPMGDAIGHFASHFRRVGQVYLDMAKKLEAVDTAAMDWTPMLFQIRDGDVVLAECRDNHDIELSKWIEKGHKNAQVFVTRKPRTDDEPIPGGDWIDDAEVGVACA